MSPSLKYGLSAASLVLSLGVASCTPDPNSPGVEYAPEMYESIPYEPLRQIRFNTINSFGINERTPAAGTVPRGKLAYFDHIPKDSVGIAERTLHNPYAYTKENVLEGQALFTRYCQHCHGEKGDGQGPVGMKFKGVPNYSAGAYKTMNDGHIYHVIEWGRNRMMPHGSQVNPEERWKIAMYVHVLQINNDPADLPKVVKVAAPADVTSASTGEASAMTDPTNQKPEGKANANSHSETPGQGTKGRNGSMN
ncbi:c-type cytochrome [Hymenobacter baengnokdamensis]|uniref:c-type cytochrome n=1 Tax=Hymenobacter baengnokdamensis TaxID=2615203 RepID=UPI0012474C82|nr:cytochrome c [Hymenobacter baengnokdamensis]